MNILCPRNEISDIEFVPHMYATGILYYYYFIAATLLNSMLYIYVITCIMIFYFQAMNKLFEKKNIMYWNSYFKTNLISISV